MSINRLVEEGSIHPFNATSAEIARAMEIARRDLALAENIIGESLDWSYFIAYNAVLQASRAFMFYQGYRPASFESYKAVFEFMRLTIEDSMKNTMDYFDRVRNKRHRTVYDETGLITEVEAKQLLKKAGEFIVYIEGKLKE